VTLSLIACSGGPGGSGPTGAPLPTEPGKSGDDTNGGGQPSTGEPGHPDGPRFLTLASSATTIEPGDTFVVTAVMTDPDGLEDLAGGALVDESGSTFGAFGTGTQKGGYQIDLSWSSLDKAKRINFAQGAQGKRTLKAQFFDSAGHLSEKTIDIGLSCSGKAACDGACVDTTNDADNCGTCGTTCSSASGEPGYEKRFCHAGKCAQLGACGTHYQFATCASYCANKGKTCANACGNGQSGQLGFTENACGAGVATYESCDDILGGGLGIVAWQCCCL
jgi:hypothetical protein